MNPKIDAFFDALDAIGLRARVYMKSLFGLVLLAQALIATNVIPVPTGSKLATYVGILNAVVGYFTIRSKKQADTLVQAEAPTLVVPPRYRAPVDDDAKTPAITRR